MTTPEPNWAHAPSPFAWTVRIHGGNNPRTGFAQLPLEVQFHKRTRDGGAGYGIEGILHRANDFAKGEWRTHFAVREIDGSTLYAGPVLNEIDAPRVFREMAAAVARARAA